MKKMILILTAFCVGYFFMGASTENTNIYTVECEAEIVIDQLFESKNVETYKFVIDNALEDSCFHTSFYIDDEEFITYQQVIIFSEETTYLFVGTTTKHLMITPYKKSKHIDSKANVDVSVLDERFVYALENVKYIRKDKGIIKDGDLIMQFENSYNNHKYRIDILYSIHSKTYEL